MNKINNTTLDQQSNTRYKSHNIKKNMRAEKKLRILLHILRSPQGVSEKSINSAANVISGRDYSTQLQRDNDVLLAYPVIRLKDKEGCSYSLYQLLNTEQAHKLAKLIIFHCKRFYLDYPSEASLNMQANLFHDHGEVAA
jgi:hypothetical protein